MGDIFTLIIKIKNRTVSVLMLANKIDLIFFFLILSINVEKTETYSIVN